MEDAHPERRPDHLSWALFAALAAVYRWGRCPSYGPRDSADLVYRAVYAPGLDPLANLGRLVSRLPLDTPEGWVNSVSGAFHAGAAALLFALLRRLGVQRVPALAAAVLLAFLHQYWYYALVAGNGPAAVLGAALAVWSVVAWKEGARPWPLAFGLLGLALAAVYAPRACTLVPLALWGAAGAAGLLLQRLELARPNAAYGALAASLLLPLARPYDLRSHNPTREWARTALDSAAGAACIVTPDRSLAAALRFEARASGRDMTVADSPCAEPMFDPLIRFSCRPSPRGILLGPCPSSWTTDARRRAASDARTALTLPALSSVGRRDREKYSFAGEDGLYDRYAAVLRVYRDLSPDDDDRLRAKIDAQLADYQPLAAAP